MYLGPGASAWADVVGDAMVAAARRRLGAMAPPGSSSFEADGDSKHSLTAKLDNLEVSGFAIGMRVQGRAEDALAQVRRIGMLASFAAGVQGEAWRGRYEEHYLGGNGEGDKGSPFISFRLDGSLLPWDQLTPTWQTVEEAFPAEAIPFIERAKTLQVSVAVGVLDGEWLVVGFGPSGVDHVEDLLLHGTDGGSGAEASLLWNHDLMAPVRAAAEGLDLSSVSYLSAALDASLHRALEVSSFLSDIDTFNNLAEWEAELLDGGGEGSGATSAAAMDNEAAFWTSVRASVLSPDLRKEVLLGTGLEHNLPASLVIPAPLAHGSVSYEYETERGIEFMSYSSRQASEEDDEEPAVVASPLRILNHVGNNPALLFAASDDAMLGPGVFDGLAAMTEYASTATSMFMLPHDHAVLDAYLDTLASAAKALETSLTDALASVAPPGIGSAIVVDVETVSSGSGLPLVGLAAVQEVGDRAALEAALAEIARVSTDTLASLEALRVEDFLNQVLERNETYATGAEGPPVFSLPPFFRHDPEGDGPGEEIWFAPIEEDLGLPADVAINYGTSDRVLVYSYLPEQTRRFFRQRSASDDDAGAMDSGSVFAAVPLADRDAPLLWAAHVQVGPLVDAAVAHLNAWNAASAEDGAFVDPGLAMAAAEFGSHAWFLKCFKVRSFGG